MVVQEHIEVRIVSEGHPLVELDEPDKLMVPPNSQVKFVEVSTGAEFSVRIQLWPGFNFYDADALYYEIYIDDIDFRHLGEINKRDVHQIDGKVRTHHTKLRASTFFHNAQDGGSELGNFQFGVLSMGKNLDQVLLAS